MLYKATTTQNQFKFTDPTGMKNKQRNKKQARRIQNGAKVRTQLKLKHIEACTAGMHNTSNRHAPLENTLLKTANKARNKRITATCKSTKA
jgi:hypothetical protein